MAVAKDRLTITIDGEAKAWLMNQGWLTRTSASAALQGGEGHE